MEDLTGRQFGAYRIVAPLGEGGMAAVYKAYQPAVDRYVALKVLGRHFAANPHFVSRFRHEAKIVAQLQHPHILPVFDFGETDGYSFLAMPFIHGGTLAALLQGEPASRLLTQRVVSQVCAALDYAHSKGVVHRDIKPSNILIDEGGNCLVADFGIARLTESVTRLTMTGALMGTPAYMSPEQASGQEVERRSDQYSFGIVLYEMVAGRVPFDAETPVAIAIKHITAPLPPPRHFSPSVTPEVEAVVLKALARSKEDRFPSCAELAASFAAAVQETQVFSLPSGGAARSRQLGSIAVAPGPGDAAEVRSPIATNQPNVVAQPIDDLAGAEPAGPSTARRILTWSAISIAIVAIAVAVIVWRSTSPPVERRTPSALEAAASTTVPPAPVVPEPVRDGRGRTAPARGMTQPISPAPPLGAKPQVPAPPPRQAEHVEPPPPELADNPPRPPIQAPTPDVQPDAVTRDGAALSDPGPTFTFSPNKATAGATLTSGTRLEFSAVGIKPAEVFQFNRCNGTCSSASQLRRWTSQSFASGPQVMSAPGDGRYYFWLGEPRQDGVMVVHGESAQTDGATTTIRYTSGTVISVKTGAPQGTGVRTAPPPPAAVRVGGAIKQPTKTKDAKPVYPAVAQSSRVQGVVILEVTIGPNGKVQDAKVLRSIPLLDAAALDAVRQWEFTTTMLNGVPVAVLMTVTVNFYLQ